MIKVMHCNLSFLQDKRILKLVQCYQFLQQEALHKNKITNLEALKVFLLNILVTFLQFQVFKNIYFLVLIPNILKMYFCSSHLQLTNPLEVPLTFYSNFLNLFLLLFKTYLLLEL